MKKLRLARRAESLRKSRKEFSRNCRDFLSQPYAFARNIISPKPSGELQSSQEEVQNYLKAAHGDENREVKRRLHKDLKEYATPNKPFNDIPPTYSEFAKKLRKARSKSSPGPNGVPYLLYKRCPETARIMWRYLKAIWKSNKISAAWREAEGIFIPKEEGAKTIDKFRTISLLNVEGKLFFGLKSDRILNFVVDNGYLDTSIQKGGVPQISGCLEHTAIVSQMIREAKEGKKNLVVTWLDIANAYGSIPHNLIKTALEQAHLPEQVCSLIESYYNDVRIRFKTRNFMTEWQRLEKGIITGCTLSVILFALTMTWLVVSEKNKTKGPKLQSGQRQENSRLFIDDITTTTETIPQTRDLLNSLVDKLNWAGLKVKPEKCRALVIVKGKVVRRKIEINKTAITPIQDKPVKYLGKEFCSNLNERGQTKKVEQELQKMINKIDKCRIPGRYKAWMLEKMLLPKLMWPLNIYNIPATKIESMQRRITAAYKKWLGLPKSMSVDCFYSKSMKLQLPYTELKEEVKAAKARNLVTLEESSDPCISKAVIKVDEGRKNNTPAEVREAKSKLKMQEIAGIGNRGREGLGLTKRQYYSSSNKKDQRDMIVKEVRSKEEERRRGKIVELAQQGASTRWEVAQRRLTHEEMIRSSETRLKFLIKSVYDLLPTPSNKNKWYGTEERCQLCGEECTLNHILSGCKVALTQGRYKWRHDKVLRVLAKSVEEKVISSNCQEKSNKKEVQFIKEGETCQSPAQKTQDSFLNTATDWKLRVDLDCKLRVPAEVTVTDLRPDMLIVSESTKQMAIIELTVPSEERVEVAGELKRSKYEQIATEGKINGWRIRIWAVEIGCRGFPAGSTVTLLKELGFNGKRRKGILKILSETAEEASRSIWRWSHQKQWG